MDRLFGLLLFLPVPIVLWLFTRAPLGVAASLALGTVLMVTHRLYARPFALTRAPRRCLWCGGGAADGPSLVIEEPLGVTTWRACGAAHAALVGRVLAWARRHATFLRAGILGTLGLFLPLALLAGTERLGPLRREDAVAFFRLGIALTVLPLGLLSTRPGPVEPGPERPPFPVHIQALVGTRAVLWLFRLIGSVWLVQALVHVVRRGGGA
jgi:hypothetical protein